MNANLSFELRQTNLNRTNLKNKRAQGQIPATLFGKTFQSTPVFVKANSGQMRGLHSGSMFRFQWEGRDYRATLSEIQRDALAREITHLSFHVFRNDEMITVELPIVLQGKAAGERLGGLTHTLKPTIAVKGLPDSIPESIVIDVTSIELGGRICVADVKLPNGLKLAEGNTEQAVAICHAPRKEAETTATTTASAAATTTAATATTGNNA